MLPSQVRYINLIKMQNSHEKSKRQTEQSYTQSDFIPPQHSYLEHEPYNSAFFKDHCEEEYQIRRAFQADNFTYLRSKIPNQLKHGAILEQRLNKVQQNSELQTINRRKTAEEKQDEKKDKVAKKKMEQIGQLGYFQIFPYQESLYSIQHELQLRQKNKAKLKQENISLLDFRPAGFDKKLKYQNPFTYIDRLDSTMANKQPYLYPFHVPQDTYDRFHESELRQRIIQQAGKIAGDFIPASNDKSLTKVTRARTGEILKQLQTYLKKYLPDTGFFIGMNKRDYIDLLYESKEIDNSRLQLVMSRLCEHESLSKYILRRNHHKWGKIGESGYLQYCVLPPWVKDPQQKLIKQ